MPNADVATGGISLVPDNFAVKLLEFCCANIEVMRPVVAEDRNNNVTTAVQKITTVLIFVTMGRTM